LETGNRFHRAPIAGFSAGHRGQRHDCEVMV
jgi:hypothetical protein